MGAAAVPLMMAAGSFAAAKLSGADTKTAIGAGILGGVGGWAAGGAGGLFGAGGAGSAAGMVGTGLGQMMQSGGGGGGATANPFGAAFTGGTATPAGGGGVSGGAGMAPAVGDLLGSQGQKQGMVLGSPFDAYGQKTNNPGNPQKAKEMQDALMGVGSMYGANRMIQSEEDKLEVEKLKAQAEAQALRYRAAPNPGFAPAVGGQIPQMGGGFAFGR